MAIPIELQGEGSYEYDCGKHDCEYCRATTIANYAKIAPKPKAVRKPVAIIKQTPWPKYRASTMIKGDINR